MISEFTQVYTLPDAQIKTVVGNWHGDSETDKRRFDMRWHIVIAFYCVFIERFALLNELIEAVSEVFADRWIVVFIDGQSC